MVSVPYLVSAKDVMDFDSASLYEETPSSSLLSRNILSGRVTSAKLPETGTVTCPHCDSVLSEKTYKRHLHLFYDTQKQEWIKKPKTKQEGIFKNV